MKNSYLFLTLIILFIACHPGKKESIILSDTPKTTPFLPGVDNFMQNFRHLVKNKKVGLLTNPSGANRQLIATSDLLDQAPDIHLTALFGPEHGIRGAIHAGQHIADTTDAKTGLPVFSLYGKKRKPTPDMLSDVDVMLVDIQDIGLRAYTYIYTMARVMEAAAENDKKVIVFDRPNPIGGIRVEGNLAEEPYFSFVGLYPIPYQHGMTIGELALLFNTEFNINCDLQVIPMQGWQRHMFWEETGLVWIPTSPHVPHWKTVLYMGATGTFGELGVLSEGVGYTSPFEILGAPWIQGQLFAAKLNQLNLPGVIFRPLYFKPYYLHYQGQICQGVQLHLTDARAFRPYATGLHIMRIHMDIYPQQDLFQKPGRVNMFDKVVGTDKIRKSLIDGLSVEEIEQNWQENLNKFKDNRIKYLLY